MATPVEAFILGARDIVIPILLWLLTLAIVWGMLQHANTPKSPGARSVIAICAAFIVLFLATTMLTDFLGKLIISAVVIGVGLLITIMFLELSGVKVGEGKNLFQAHPKFFGGIILILVIAVFMGAGGMNIIGIPQIQISDTVIAFIVFLGVMLGAIYMMMAETKEKK